MDHCGKWYARASLGALAACRTNEKTRASLKAASLCGLSLPLPLGLGLLSGLALSLPMGLWLWLMLSEELRLGLACRHALHSHGYLDAVQAKQKKKKVMDQWTISHGMPSTRLPPIPLHLTQ